MILSHAYAMERAWPRLSMPVFSASGSRTKFFQSVSTDRKISSFHACGSLDPKRLKKIIPSPTKCSIGDYHYIIMEFDTDTVYAIQPNVLGKAKTVDLLHSYGLGRKEHPFLYLEISRIFEDIGFHQECYQYCVSFLSRAGNSVVEQWIKTTDSMDGFDSSTFIERNTLSGDFREVSEFRTYAPTAVSAFLTERAGFSLSRSEIVQEAIESAELSADRRYIIWDNEPLKSDVSYIFSHYENTVNQYIESYRPSIHADSHNLLEIAIRSALYPIGHSRLSLKLTSYQKKLITQTLTRHKFTNIERPSGELILYLIAIQNRSAISRIQENLENSYVAIRRRLADEMEGLWHPNSTCEDEGK